MGNYNFQQVEAGNMLSRDAQNKDFLFESVTHGLLNPDMVEENRQLRHANIRANIIGQSDDVLKVALRDSDRELYGGMADAHAARSPENALEYLAREDVKAVFTPDELKERQERYQNAATTVAIAKQAKEAVDSGLSPAEIYDKSLEYESDKKRQAFLTETASYQNRKVLAQKAERAAYNQEIENEFAASGYMTIPDRAMHDRELYASLMDFKSKLVSFNGEKAIPNEQFLIDLYNQSPEEIEAYLADGKNFSEYLKNLAGDSDWKTAINNKRKGIESEDGRSGVYGGLDVADMLGGDFIRLKGYEGWVSDTEYNASNPAHKRTMNNFLHQFRKRWRDKENYYPTAKADERAENIYYDMIRENREGKLKLNDPSYDIEMERRLQDAANNPRLESVNEKTGKTEVTFQDGESVKTFVKLDAQGIQAFGDRDIREAYQVPDDAESGTFRSVGYQAGDRIGIGVNRRTGRADVILVYDRNWNLRPESFDFDIARRGQFTGAVLPPETARPAKTPQMVDWERENKAEFVWQPRMNRWVAEAADVNYTGSTVAYEASPEGDHIFKAGQKILDKISSLEAEVTAFRELRHELDKLGPRAPTVMRFNLSRQIEERRQAADKAEKEITRLKAEYDRVTGKNAKESEFYVSGK